MTRALLQQAKSISQPVDLRVRKAAFKSAYLSYKAAGAHLDCGSELSKEINADVSEAASRCNTLAAWLQANDPDFPKTWRLL